MAQTQVAKICINGCTYKIIKKDGLFFLYSKWFECGYDDAGNWQTANRQKLIGKFGRCEDALKEIIRIA